MYSKKFKSVDLYSFVADVYLVMFYAHTNMLHVRIQISV